MSLIDKKSLFDRHTKGTLGTSVGNNGQGPIPSDGNYFVNDGMDMSSPFEQAKGQGSGDHMIDLLQNQVNSLNLKNSEGNALSYIPSNQDLNGGTDFHSGQEPFNGTTSPFGTYGTTLKQFGGPYKTNGPVDGFY